MLLAWVGWLGCSPDIPTLAPADAEAIIRLEKACACKIALTQEPVPVGEVYARVGEGRVIVLKLQNTTLSSSALVDLATLTQLHHLNLSGTKVDSLESLPELPTLYDLDVSNTAIASLSGLERSPVSWLDISNTRITTLDGVPSTVKTLIAGDLDVTLPEDHGFRYVTTSQGVTSTVLPKTLLNTKAETSTKAESSISTTSGNPAPLDVDLPSGWRGAQRGSGTSRHNGFTGVHSGSISTGSGLLRIEMDGLRKSAGVVELALQSGSARVWLMDDQGEWLAYALLPGELRLYGHFGAWGLDHYFFVQSTDGFEGLNWTVK